LTDRTILWNVRVVAGDGSPPAERMAVTVADGRIESIGSIGESAPPPGAIDSGGRTLMPGLIDAHVHLSSDTSRSPGFGAPQHLQGEEPRRRELGYFVLARTTTALLAAGITTVRDVGSYDDEGIAVRQAVDLGLLDGPRVLPCGRIISATSPGGAIFGTMYRQADGPDEMRKAVREQIRAGAGFIKVMATGARSVVREDPEPAQMTPAELAVIVEEAHRMGFRVAAHAEGLEGTRMAIEQGVDTIEHGLSLHRAPELLATMAERGQVLVPTLSTFHDLSERFVTCFAPVLVEQAKVQQEEAYATVAAARAAGVTMAMGHDSGPPGDNLSSWCGWPMPGSATRRRCARPRPAPQQRWASTTSALSGKAPWPICWWWTAIRSQGSPCFTSGSGSGWCWSPAARWPGRLWLPPPCRQALLGWRQTR